ncbi:nucleotide pyrophosphohydrolase [Dendrosporobacter sp. 1207_IL3150]|uniref:nucleotide pyrophosphohydrolase n=1 Tax=Dendrosporobacter sp. 1207_IL3150 TaxID=3084054 RepID=UPI002FD9E340
MFKAIHLPKLNNLSPTLQSTLLKIMEEAGELARAVLVFLPCEQAADKQETLKYLDDVSSELLDVAQTCVTMIFVMEDYYGIQPQSLVSSHLEKLEAKGYSFDKSQCYRIETAGNYKYLALPRLNLEGVTLLTTVCKIQEEIGELTQYLGKKAGASGEKQALSSESILLGCASELLDVAQCCFTMMYILAEKYQVDINMLTQNHIAKLRRKGYCA